jgi:hypothetical protein
MDDRGSGSSREELQTALLQERNLLNLLLTRVGDPNVPPVQLVDIAEALEPLAAKRAELVQHLREEASEARRRQEERSVRQFVLRALDEIGCAQNAAFLQEYVWLRDRIDLDPRGFGALRRDERRAWGRNPGRRLAYVVSALGTNGEPLARWMARSDWPVLNRLVLPDDERLLDLRKMRALFRARRELDVTPRGLPDPFVSLVRKYSLAVFEEAAPEASGSQERDRWFREREVQCEAEIGNFESATEATRRDIAERLERLPAEALLWGPAGPTAA